MRAAPFPSADIDLLKARLRLTPSQRLRAMFDARDLIFALKRGRLRQQFPALSDGELNLKILEEIELVRSLPRYSFGNPEELDSGD